MADEALKEIVYDLIDIQADKRMKYEAIQRAIVDQHPEYHVGDARRAIRLLADEGRVIFEQGLMISIR